MNFLKEAAFVATIAGCMNLTVHAQNNISKYEFGIHVGFLVYQGDLTPQKLGSFKTQTPAIGLYASRIFSPSFSLRTNLAFGKLKGDDAKYSFPAYRQQRNFNFSSPVIEISELLVWNAVARDYINWEFSPYLFAGVGFSFLRISRDWSNINTAYFSPESSEIWTGIVTDAAHTPPRLIAVVPAGAGLKYFISPVWAINAETSYRFVFTDYLDGFSHAADPQRDDHYFEYSAGLIYRAGKKDRLGCPVIKY